MIALRAWAPTKAEAILLRVLLGTLFVAVVRIVFGLSVAQLIGGLALGSLYGLIAVALVLMYQTKRIINFAAAAIGAVPAIVALMMDIQLGVNYVLALPVAVVGGALFGAATDLLVMRRLSRAPRLITTVATIGVAQSYAALGFFIPVWFGARSGETPQVPTPWQDMALRNSRGEPVLSGNQAFAFLVAIAISVGLSVMLRRTRVGVAARAIAHNVDRASTLGIPVSRINLLVWGTGGLCASLAVFAQAPLIGVPGNATLGFDALLYGLAAALVARMKSIGVAMVAASAIGVLIYGSIAKTGTDNLASVIVLGIVLVALLAQRRELDRSAGEADVGPGSARATRPLPREFQRLPGVLVARVGGVVLFVGSALLLPFVVGPSHLPALSLLPIYGIVAVSLVVLTGWAGQISLGQFGLVGVAAAVTGGVVARHNIDFFAALALGVAAGTVSAVVIGLPAIRIRGLFLAVTTLAFSFAIENYVLDRYSFVGRNVLPPGPAATISRPSLYGWLDLEGDTAFYVVCLVFYLLAVAAALAMRHNRSGRVLIAVAENDRAAASVAINPIRTRLAAFAISGGLAGLAGTLFAYQQHNVIAGTYGVPASIAVFLAATIGGLTSVWSASVCTMAFEASVLFGAEVYHRFGPTLTSTMPLLLSGPVLLAVLWISPGGIGAPVRAARDHGLRRLARQSRVSASTGNGAAVCMPEARP